MRVVNGAGSQGLIKFGSTVSGSTFRMKHLGFSTLKLRRGRPCALTFRVICGPAGGYQVELYRGQHDLHPHVHDRVTPSTVHRPPLGG